MPGLHQDPPPPKKKTLDSEYLNKYLILDELRNKIENKGAQNKFKTVTVITLDSFLKPTDQ
jgi:hypothetical protein